METTSEEKIQLVRLDFNRKIDEMRTNFEKIDFKFETNDMAINM